MSEGASFSDILGDYLDALVVSLSQIAAESEIFADRCVLNGFVPPHPGDVERALSASAKQPGQTVRMRSDHLYEPTNDKLPELTAEERRKIIAQLRDVKNTLSQYVITKLHDQFPRISTRDMRNIVRSMIGTGEVHMPYGPEFNQ